MNDLGELLHSARDAIAHASGPIPERDLQHVHAVVRRARIQRHTVESFGAAAFAGVIGVGAWTAYGHGSREPVTPASTSPTSSPTSKPTPTPTPTPESPAAMPTTTAVSAVEDTKRQWFRMGGQVFADAPLATFPVSASADKGLPGCTDEQFAWLTKYGLAARGGISLNEIGAGEGIAPELEYKLTNVATSGAVSVRNLRVEGSFTSQNPPRFTFACVNGGIGGDEAPYWELATIGDSSPATYVVAPAADGYWNADEKLDPALVGAPFTANLEPGGALELNLILKSPDSSRDFRGRIVGDVVIGDQTYREVLDEGFLQTAPASLRTVFAIAGFGRLFCFTDEATYQQASVDGVAGGSYESLAPYECTPQALADLVAAAQ